MRRRLIGVTAAAAAAAGALTLGVVLAAGGVSDATVPAAEGPLFITTEPPRLVPTGAVVPLRFQVDCEVAGRALPPYDECPVAGSVRVEPFGGGAPVVLPLARLADATPPFRWGVTVPEALLAEGGFAYSLEATDISTGRSGRFPSAPARDVVRVLAATRTVDLGAHAFGATAGGQSVFTAPWGGGSGAVGRSGGSESAVVGPAGYTVRADGSLQVLDQVNGRILDVVDGVVRGATPVQADGELVGVVPGADAGTTFALVRSTTRTRTSHLLSLGSREQVPTADELADAVLPGPTGPEVFGFPSQLWFRPVAGGSARATAEQAGGASDALPDPAGAGRLALAALPRETRVALVSGERMLRSWVVRSGSELGDVALVATTDGGRGLLLVRRAYTDTAAEYLVTHVRPDGTAATRAVLTGDYATGAPFSRFQLAGGWLYQLTTSPDGAAVVRHDLGSVR